MADTTVTELRTSPERGRERFVPNAKMRPVRYAPGGSRRKHKLTVTVPAAGNAVTAVGTPTTAKNTNDIKGNVGLPSASECH